MKESEKKSVFGLVNVWPLQGTVMISSPYISIISVMFLNVLLCASSVMIRAAEGLARNTPLVVSQTQYKHYLHNVADNN